MTTPSTVRVVAKSDRDAFVGVHGDEYCVFSLGDTHEIAIGDQLQGDFHGHSASTFAAQNLTRHDRPWIDLEDWELSLDLAIQRLLALRSPEKVFAGSKMIMSKSDQVVLELRDGILRSGV